MRLISLLIMIKLNENISLFCPFKINKNEVINVKKM
jgi:hypothetical protein